VTHIYLHRANRLDQVVAAIKAGYGVEVDIRTHNGRAYLSHDPIYDRELPHLLSGQHLLELVVMLEGKAILDFKESGVAQAMWQSVRVMADNGYWDFRQVADRLVSTDLIVPDQLALRKLQARSLSRASRWERIASQEFGGVWLDYVLEESELPEEVGEGTFLVSPELHTKKRPDESFVRRAMSMGFEGVCTDYPDLYAKFA
jgi:hypothetical protein